MGLWDQGRTQARNKVTSYQWKLDERMTCTLDSNGNGTMQLSPQGAREKWVLNFVAVNVTDIPPASINVPQMVMYRSAPVPGNQLGGTFSSILDADSSSTYELNMGEPVVFVFSGGDAGSNAHVHIEGIRYVWE